MKVPNWGIVWSKHTTTVQLVLMQVLAAGTAFVVNILSASVMEPEGRGYLALLVQITYVLTVAVMLGIERPFIATRQAGFGQALSELTRLLGPGYIFIGTLVALSAFLLFGEFQGLAISAVLVIFYLLGNVCSRLVRTSFIASSRISPFVIVSVSTQGILLLMAGVLFLSRNSSPEFWFLAYGSSGTVALLVTVYAAVRMRRGSVRRSCEKIIRRDGLKLLPASFGNTAMLRSDRLLLPFLASNSQLGIYIVVATTMELASWPVQNWVDASLNRWRRDHGKLGSGWKTILLAVAATFVLAVLMGVASFLLIRLVLGESYAASEVLIIPLGSAAVVYAASRVQQGLFIATGRAGLVSNTEIVGMAVSVCGYLVLIPPFGAMGAALASIVGYAACFAAGALFARHRVYEGDR